MTLHLAGYVDAAADRSQGAPVALGRCAITLTDAGQVDLPDACGLPNSLPDGTEAADG